MSFLINYSPVKRTFDISLSCIGLFLSVPLWILFSFAIWVEGGRPIFYIQVRVGKDNRLFEAIKFRTMGYKKKYSRLSGLLRTTALDELPQLINIIKGQMSFVGPRPLIPQEIQMTKGFNLRSTVPPGLTGLAQVLASKDAPISEKFNYDISYIKNQNIGLDILLILKSFKISLTRKWDVINNGLK